MTEQQPSPDGVPDDLAAAIEENPAAFAMFVRNLETVNELLEVADLGAAALDDEMVAALSRTGERVAASADAAATDGTVDLATAVGENGETLGDAVEALARLQRSGALDDVVELAELASLVTAALDDEMVTSLAGTGGSLGELADSAAADDTRTALQRLLAALGDAHRNGPVDRSDIWSGFRNGEFFAAIGYVLSILRSLGRAVTDR
ncbi:YdeI/OmpD-associated family protein [Halomicroarcula sp. GCM10025709]|uniref:YdeI/OmpD-associated family protein n=1 Tax=Haloarcula TaxID=2237 RepID=UPI0024C25C2E|nr:YdeI/OmpD-associated family protein [Halomicroarcula sp. YJ-61-S]